MADGVWHGDVTFLKAAGESDRWISSADGVLVRRRWQAHRIT